MKYIYCPKSKSNARVSLESCKFKECHETCKEYLANCYTRMHPELAEYCKWFTEQDLRQNWKQAVSQALNELAA